MSLVLLVGAGLFLRSWQQMLSVDPGFGRAPTSVLSIMMPVARLTSDEAVQRTRRVLERFRAQPGVEAAGLVWPLPLEFAASFTDFTIDGRVPPPGQEAFRADRATVDGAFFDAAGMVIVAAAPSTKAIGERGNPWPSSARLWPVATGQTGTRWATSSAGLIRPNPT